jgi:hypothetical protein
LTFISKTQNHRNQIKPSTFQFAYTSKPVTTMASKSSSSKTTGTQSLMASLPDDPESSVAAPTTAKSGTGVLSRTSLYTPLSFYTSQRASANNNTNNKKQQHNIPKNAQESSLVEFMASTVSTAYHLSSEGRCKNKSSNQKDDSAVTVLSVKHARNTGNRPLNVGEINSRIRQRALTLVGGGYNASVVTGGDDVSGSNRAVKGAATAKQAMNAHGKRSAIAANSRSRTSADRQQRRQRKKRKKTALTEKNGGVTAPVMAGAGDVSSCQTDTDNSVNVDTDMLRQMHNMWLDYLWNLLRIVLPTTADSSRNNDKGSNKKTKKGSAGATTTLSPLELVRSKLPGLLLQTTTAASGPTSASKATPGAVALELVGAKVRVQACARHPACQGRTGVLVQATSETYQIAVPGVIVPVPATLEDAAETVIADATATTTTRTPSPPTPTIQTWIIPKRGSRLELLLPVDHLTNKYGAGTTVDVDPFSSGSSDQPQLCILLDSNQHQPARINK